MLSPEAIDLKSKLSHVLWIGGPPDGGKTTIADLLGATYEYFPGASHFGLVMGSDSWPQVAGSVLGWLEERRHVMVAALAGAAAR